MICSSLFKYFPYSSTSFSTLPAYICRYCRTGMTSATSGIDALLKMSIADLSCRMSDALCTDRQYFAQSFHSGLRRSWGMGSRSRHNTRDSKFEETGGESEGMEDSDSRVYCEDYYISLFSIPRYMHTHVRWFKYDSEITGVKIVSRP